MKESKRIRTALNKSIKAVCQSKNQYCLNPDKDFTRCKKLPMNKVIKTVLGFSSKSLTNELIDVFSGDSSIASASAFVQQRSKILPSAFEEIFKQFINTMNPVKLYEGFRLLAVDGSDIQATVPGVEPQPPIMSDFQSLSAYRRSQPDRVTPPLHREILENNLILGAKQLLTSRFGTNRGKAGVNTDVFTRILTMSRRKSAAKNRFGFGSRYPYHKNRIGKPFSPANAVFCYMIDYGEACCRSLSRK